MTRPSFQFYPGDWLKDTKLRRCSHAARGAWIDVLCVLHDSEEYGVARFPMAELANAAGAPIKLLKELADKGVLKGCDKGECAPLIYTPRSGRKAGPPVTLVPPTVGPIWYSSRMVRDEYVRTVRGEGSRFGGTSGDGSGDAPKPSPKGGFGEGQSDGSSSSSSTSYGNTSVSPPSGAGAGAHEEPDLTGFQPTPAGVICRALREAGIGNVNPGHPRLQALLNAGAAEAEFVAFAEKAKAASDPFAYVLGAVEGERKRAAASAGQLHRGPMPTPKVPPTESAYDRRMREQYLAIVPSVAAPSPAGAQPADFIDVSAVEVLHAPKRLR